MRGMIQSKVDQRNRNVNLICSYPKEGHTSTFNEEKSLGNWKWNER
jgi:hypothetical protein